MKKNITGARQSVLTIKIKLFVDSVIVSPSFLQSHNRTVIPSVKRKKCMSTQSF